MQEKKELGKIESTHLGYEDHGIFSFMIQFDFGGMGQGFGNYGLSIYDKKKDKQAPCVEMGATIMGILDAMGVEKWEDLPEKIA